MRSARIRTSRFVGRQCQTLRWSFARHFAVKQTYAATCTAIISAGHMQQHAPPLFPQDICSNINMQTYAATCTAIISAGHMQQHAPPLFPQDICSNMHRHHFRRTYAAILTCRHMQQHAPPLFPQDICSNMHRHHFRRTYAAILTCSINDIHLAYTIIDIYLRLRASHASNAIIVELKLVDNTVFEFVPSLLFSVYSLYSRSKNRRLYFYLILNAIDVSFELIRQFLESMRPFASWLETTIEQILWVDVPFSIEIGGIIADNIFLSRIKSAEDLVRRIHHMAKIYMRMHQDLKNIELSSNNFSSLDVDQIKDLIAKLENQWSIVINEPEGLNLLEDGRLICEQLVKQYPMLEELDSFLYVDIVDQTIRAYKELSSVIPNIESAKSRKLRSLLVAIDAVEFLEIVLKKSHSFEKTLKELERMKNVKSFNAARLSTQLKKIEERAAEEDIQLNEALDYLDNTKDLLEEYSISDSNREILKNARKSLEDIVGTTKERIEDVRKSIQNALECRRLVDQVLFMKLYVKVF
ncbi:unnamed protein product [Dracunculus medinensis]|uniref:Coiled-coil domain-containing protein 22 homolog n=1 Tax=Dracunculus medinensis TaxID=318479 RepID=A0A0N4U7C3_DRAME|nr:unnamed protein product [Dracunculus medinensis]